MNRDDWVKVMSEDIPPGSRVLDAGAGFLRYKDLFQHCEYRAQDFCDYQGSEWHYGKMDYVCDITSIPVEDGSFDVVICTEVLEHVPEPIKAIGEFSRIMKPAGTLLLTAPLGCGLHQKPHIYYGGFSPYWYKKYLAQYGLEVVEIKPNGGFFLNYAQETGRITSYLFPANRFLVSRIVIFPLEAVSKVFLHLLIPLACHWLDRIYPDYDFTVGYFVKARKPEEG